MRNTEKKILRFSIKQNQIPYRFIKYLIKTNYFNDLFTIDILTLKN